jgi:hypothetical protein
MGGDVSQWPSARACWPRGFIEQDLRLVMEKMRRQPQPPKLRAALKQWEAKWLSPMPGTAEQAVDELFAILERWRPYLD